MKNLFLFGCLLVIHLVVAPPPNKRADTNPSETDNEVKQEYAESSKYQENEYPESFNNVDDLKLEYEKYMHQVVSLLETDPEFKKKVESVDDKEIQTGQIAKELEFVNHHVRTKLDELKRTEIERLRQLAHKAYVNSNGSEVHKLPEHLDHTNTQSFEVADLQALILKATKDLSEIDKKRKKMFKEYEMKKHLEEQKKLELMTDEQKAEFLAKKKAEDLKHHEQNKHLNHPGGKKQIEEVWEQQDHMQKQNFNPRTFFLMHDLNSDGFWDEEEVKVLFLREVEKIHGDGGYPDPIEKSEELERMREHYFNEVDKNGDRLISDKEFLSYTQQIEFKQNDAWKPLNEQQVYTPEELHAYEMQQQHINQLIQEGKLPPNAAYQYQGIPPPQPPQSYHYDPNAIPQHGGHAQPYQAAGHVPQQYQAGHAPQYQAAGHAPQYQAAGHAPQYQAAGHAPQYQAAGHAQQYQAAGHGQAQQYQAAGHAQQYQAAGHAQQYQAAGHVPQYQTGGNAQQFQAGGHVQQFQATGHAQPNVAQQYHAGNQVPNQGQQHQAANQAVPQDFQKQQYAGHGSFNPPAGQQNQNSQGSQKVGQQAGYQTHEEPVQPGNANPSHNSAPAQNSVPSVQGNSQNLNNQQQPVKVDSHQQFGNDNSISQGSAPANNIQDGGYQAKNMYQTGGNSNDINKSNPAQNHDNSHLDNRIPAS